jgi:hypothetical protein
MSFFHRLLGQPADDVPRARYPDQGLSSDDNIDDDFVDDTNIDDAEIERRDRLGREWDERNLGREQPVECTQCGEATMRDRAEQAAWSAADAVVPDGGVVYAMNLPTVDQFGDPVPAWIPDYGWAVPDPAVTVATLADEERERVAFEFRNFGHATTPARDMTEIAQNLARLERVGLARYDPERRGWNWPIVCPTCLSEIASGHRRVRNGAGSASQRAAIAPRLRFAVMQRDGFRCTYCGRTAADGVTLHVDHVQPVAAGGVDEEGNLVTACSDCNLGKGAQEIV